MSCGSAPRRCAWLHNGISNDAMQALIMTIHGYTMHPQNPHRRRSTHGKISPAAKPPTQGRGGNFGLTVAVASTQAVPSEAQRCEGGAQASIAFAACRAGGHGSRRLCAAISPTTPFRPTLKPSATSAAMPSGTGIERFGVVASAGDEHGGECKQWRIDIFRQSASYIHGRNDDSASNTQGRSRMRYRARTDLYRGRRVIAVPTVTFNIAATR